MYQGFELPLLRYNNNWLQRQAVPLSFGTRKTW